MPILALILILIQVTSSNVVTRHVDGDTLVLDDTLKIRLFGIDCPESKPNMKARKDSRKQGIPLHSVLSEGKRAAQATAQLAPVGSRITLITKGKDKYKRTLAIVVLPNGSSLNDTLLTLGLASPYRR